MLLTNALYFKGLWSTPFDKKQTEEFDFMQLDGSKVQTDYMHRKGSFMYAEADNFWLPDIPYGNRAFSMVVLLPDEGVTSLLSDNPLFVSLIQQDVYIRVDEEGTEAAAVTGIGDVTAAPPMAQDCINFHVTRPFLYVLKEISTGTILFIGQTDQL